MQVITIDLVKDPEIKDLIADMQPGDLVDLHCSIKAMDDQTLTLTVTEASEGQDADPAAPPTAGSPDDARPNQPEAGASPILGAGDITGDEQASV